MTDTLDVRGLKCPLPALLARKRLALAKPGTVLLVVADDPMAAVDVPFMCHGEGIEVVDLTRTGDASRITLRKPARA
jgi:tRNA 2-thiouridine synthesizing protein A